MTAKPFTAATTEKEGKWEIVLTSGVDEAVLTCSSKEDADILADAATLLNLADENDYSCSAERVRRCINALKRYSYWEKWPMTRRLLGLAERLEKTEEP